MTALLEIRDLHASVGDKPILKGINLTINAGEVHAIMGPNGSGKSTMSYVLAGRDGYEVTGGDILMNGESMLEMEPDERARAGMFLAFQYPVELPGVGGMSFLRAAVNARRVEAGEEEIDQLGFVKIVREKAKLLGISDDMLKRAVNDVGENLHVAVTMGVKAGAGADLVLVDDPQRAEAHMVGIVIMAEGKAVTAVEPAEIGLATLFCRTKNFHRISP